MKENGFPICSKSLRLHTYSERAGKNSPAIIKPNQFHVSKDIDSKSNYFVWIGSTVSRSVSFVAQHDVKHCSQEAGAEYCEYIYIEGDLVSGIDIFSRQQLTINYVLFNL